MVDINNLFGIIRDSNPLCLVILHIFSFHDKGDVISDKGGDPMIFTEMKSASTYPSSFSWLRSVL